MEQTAQKFSSDQQEAIQLIKEGHHVLITGPGGTGKSFLIKHLKTTLSNVALTATTGIAAVNISGRTYHSWSGMGLGKETVDELVEKVLTSDWLKDQRSSIKSTKHLIIDEISMMGDDHFVKLDQICRAVKGCQEPFGGIQLIMFGDFLQLPPVNAQYIFTTPLWAYLLPAVVVLTTIHRQKNKEFASLLQRVRVARHTKDDLEYLTALEGKAIEGELPVVLHSHNDAVDQHNLKQLVALDGKVHTYVAKDSGAKGPLKSLDQNCITPRELKLKVASRVMLTKNLGGTLCNGTLGTVTKLTERQIFVRWDNRERDQEVHHEKWELTDTTTRDVLAQRSQFPLRLAWAITIHKSQGMTLDRANIYLGKCFAPGQAYVALSRMSNSENLCLSSFKPRCIVADAKARAFYQDPTAFTQVESKVGLI
tara:strand:+ start:2819 stop:4087 length:1269 start_codon:yes stop_codon:yes gene_type:complete